MEIILNGSGLVAALRALTLHMCCEGCFIRHSFLLY
jgi:hypothetical protein